MAGARGHCADVRVVRVRSAAMTPLFTLCKRCGRLTVPSEVGDRECIACFLDAVFTLSGIRPPVKEEVNGNTNSRVS